jgi:phosphopantetheine adenylyltransferase
MREAHVVVVVVDGVTIVAKAPRRTVTYPGLANDFDALVLSHETLPTGRKLNAYREGVLGLGPLKLLCTQRTEPHGMSSTALRRMRTK